MICETCDPEEVRKLPRGTAYKPLCENCCPHDGGLWRVTAGFVNYREGWLIEVCAKGCGAILTEEPLDETMFGSVDMACVKDASKTCPDDEHCCMIEGLLP